MVLRQLRHLRHPLPGGDQLLPGGHHPLRNGRKGEVTPSEPAIHRFEEMFLESVRAHGRVQEVKTAMLFNLRSGKPFKDCVKGLRLMIKGAIIAKGHDGRRKPRPDAGGRHF